VTIKSSNAQVATARGKVSLKTKLAFSSGSLEEAILGAASIGTMVFYNQILGVSASLCGVVFLVASIVDAVSDPLMGMWSDNFRSRWGRRHPFILFSILPLTVGFYCMYNPPSGLSEAQYFWWFLGTMITLRLGKTLNGVPHAALGAELTDDYHERTSLFGFNWVTGMVVGSLLGVFVLVVIFPSTPGYDNGLLNPERYPLLASVGAVWIAITLPICVFGTRDQIPNLHKLEAREKFDFVDYFKNLSMLLTSRSYMSLCAAWLVCMTSAGMLVVVSTFTYIYCYALSTEALTLQRFVILPGILIAVPLAAWVTGMLDKKRTVIYLFGAGATMLGLPHVLRMIGWFPENDSAWLVPMLFGAMGLAYLIIPVVFIVIDSQLVDVADEHEYRAGQRAEGVVFSVRSFAIKATTGVGGLIAGLALDYINFPTNASLENLTPDMLNGLLFINGPLYIAICFIGMLFMGMYNLSESRHGEIMATLEKRRQASSFGNTEIPHARS